MNVARAPTRASSNCIMQPESLLQLSRQAMPQPPQGSLPSLSPPEDGGWFLSSYSSLEGAKDFISHPGGVEEAGLCPQKPSPRGGALEPCSGFQGSCVIDTLHVALLLLKRGTSPLLVPLPSFVPYPPQPLGRRMCFSHSRKQCWGWRWRPANNG